MKISSASAVERLVHSTRCIAAVFTSFTFDPSFFEEQVLAALLRLTSDPLEQPERFREEGRRALQEVPVACIVDGGMRQPGHRLPYDLLEVHGRTFHPKVSLVLYEGFARLQVGSGNLTRGGYGENTELFFCRELRYEQPDDVAVLKEVEDFLGALALEVRVAGTQLSLVREELSRCMARTPQGTAAFRFLHTERGPLLPQFLSLLPENPQIVRVGVLAPFLERDDVSGDSAEEDSSVLLTLAEHGRGERTFDLGVLWEEPPQVATPQIPEISEGLGRLWCRKESGPPLTLTWLTPTDVSAKLLRFRDVAGVGRQMDRESADALREQRELWPVGDIQVFAPAALVSAVRSRVRHFQLWLHPARRLEGGRLIKRPLHAKLLLVTVRRGSRTETFVLLGSPNASRKALLVGPESAGNVEAAVAFVLEGEVTLQELVPELVACHAAQPELRERTFPASAHNWGLLIQSVWHDAAIRQLSITWEPGQTVPPPGGWELAYLDRTLATGESSPTGECVIPEFDLSPASCEVVLRVEGNEYSVPILVRDLVALPAGAGLRELSLEELLALLGNRIGSERLSLLRRRQGQAAMNAVLSAIFGEGFGPTDVFRAWWAVQEDLSDERLSFQGFRLRLEGALGAQPVWMKLREAARAGTLASSEVWFYGAELRRALAGVSPEVLAAAQEKRGALEAFIQALEVELEQLVPGDEQGPWMERIRRFYMEGA